VVPSDGVGWEELLVVTEDHVPETDHVVGYRYVSPTLVQVEIEVDMGGVPASHTPG